MGRKSFFSTMRNDREDIDPQKARQTLKDELDTQEQENRQNNWLYPRAALVGAAAGLMALLFRAGLQTARALRIDFIQWSRQFPRFGWIFPVLLAVFGALTAVYLVRRFAPEAAGSGIPHLKAVEMRIRKIRWKSLLPVKFFGGIIAIGSGMALGREGPTIQMGGAVGDAISRLLKVNVKERMILIAAGAGAGLAAAFNAPLAGLIFVLEEVQHDFQRNVFGAAFIAAMTANIVGQAGSGQFPVFSIPVYPMLPLQTLGFFAILGLAAGGVGYVFNHSLLKLSGAFSRLKGRWLVLATAAVGVLIGITGWHAPALVGSGHNLAEQTLRGEVLLAAIPLFFLIRLLLTTASYSTGAPGGIFAPMLVLGSLLGLGIGRLALFLTPGLVESAEVFAVVGMAACFAAIVQAPLTGVVIIMEMTGNYNHMLPLLVSCFFAHRIAQRLGAGPVYELLLDRDLARDADQRPLLEPALLEFKVHPKAPYAGKMLRYLGLPKDCIIVRLTDGNRDWVPNGDSVLEAQLRAVIIVSPDTKNALKVLRKGFGSHGKSSFIRQF